MAAAVGITRTELDATALRRVAARRMLALALVLDGASRADAAQAAGMDRQTLRDWVHRYNEQGLRLNTPDDAMRNNGSRRTAEKRKLLRRVAARAVAAGREPTRAD